MGIIRGLIPLNLSFFGGGGGGGFRYGRRRGRGDDNERGGRRNARDQGRRQNRDTPMDNRRQNEQTDAVARRLGLNDNERRQLHDLVHGKGWGYSRILEEAGKFFGK